MPYTLADFRRDYLKELSPEERLEGLSPEQIESYLRQRKQQRTSPKRKRKR